MDIIVLCEQEACLVLLDCPECLDELRGFLHDRTCHFHTYVNKRVWPFKACVPCVHAEGSRVASRQMNLYDIPMCLLLPASQMRGKDTFWLPSVNVRTVTSRCITYVNNACIVGSPGQQHHTSVIWYINVAGPNRLLRMCINCIDVQWLCANGQRCKYVFGYAEMHE